MVYSYSGILCSSDGKPSTTIYNNRVELIIMSRRNQPPSQKPGSVYQVQNQAKLIFGVRDQDNGYPCGARQRLKDGAQVGFRDARNALILHWGAGYVGLFGL